MPPQLAKLEITRTMRILCITSVRNEAPFLLEWIAHLMGAGVTDFLIFSNDCEDGTTQMLDCLHRAGVIEHIPQTCADETSPQWQALRAAWKHPLRKSCDWAVVCDVDEFINIHAGNGTLQSLISAVPANAEGVLLPWRLFGNNHLALSEDKPTTEQFTFSMSDDCAYPIETTFFKSLIRTNGRFNQFGVHRPKQKSAAKVGLPVWVNGSGAVMPDIFAQNPQRLSLYGLPNGRGLVECNHYSLGSAESFLLKRARGLPNRSHKEIDLSYWVDRNFNTVENTSIQKMRPATVAKYKELWAIPQLPDLHVQAVNWHHAEFLRLIERETEYQLFSRIMLAGNSQKLSQTMVTKMTQWYQKIHLGKIEAAQEAAMNKQGDLSER
jgi:hypothetical protein